VSHQWSLKIIKTVKQQAREKKETEARFRADERAH